MYGVHPTGCCDTSEFPVLCLQLWGVTVHNRVACQNALVQAIPLRPTPWLPQGHNPWALVTRLRTCLFFQFWVAHKLRTTRYAGCSRHQHSRLRHLKHQSRKHYAREQDTLNWGSRSSERVEWEAMPMSNFLPRGPKGSETVLTWHFSSSFSGLDAHASQTIAFRGPRSGSCRTESNLVRGPFLPDVRPILGPRMILVWLLRPASWTIGPTDLRVYVFWLLAWG